MRMPSPDAARPQLSSSFRTRGGILVMVENNTSTDEVVVERVEPGQKHRTNSGHRPANTHDNEHALYESGRVGG